MTELPMSMHAWRVTEPGPMASGPLTWSEVPVPEPGPGELLERVLVCGVPYGSPRCRGRSSRAPLWRDARSRSRRRSIGLERRYRVRAGGPGPDRLAAPDL